MTGRITSAQLDRAAGVLLASAAGDALGVPYEFARPPGPDELAEMRGGGLGGFAPGEWSDDTSMAVAIAEVAATGADLTTPEALDAIAQGFLRWYADEPPDIGIQTRAVLGRAARAGGSLGERMAVEAQAYALDHPRSAGNGALMRTGPVALAHLDDRDRLAQASRLVASLTHADPLAGDSCVLWGEAIRVAVLEGRFDVRAGLDLLPKSRLHDWSGRLDDAVDIERNLAERVPGARFTPNGFTVTALQAAIAAIVTTEVPPLEPSDLSFPCLHLQAALHNAVRIGNDTDTVAAIAGALLGARWGASAVPWRWRRAVHGWPGRDGRDLVTMATRIVRGEEGGIDWVEPAEVPYNDFAAALAVPHPHDDGVLLGTHRAADHDADAVVSLCRVGRRQKCFAGVGEVVESRLIDTEAPEKNPNLHFVLYDAADAVRGLRAEGKRVLLHCVAARARTPAVAAVYSVLLGHDAEAARGDLQEELPNVRGRGRLWDAVLDF